MAKIRVKKREEDKGQFQPSVEKKLAKASYEAMQLLDKKYREKLDNQIKGKWQK
jgi:hypothetical protein